MQHPTYCHHHSRSLFYPLFPLRPLSYGAPMSIMSLRLEQELGEEEEEREGRLLSDSFNQRVESREGPRPRPSPPCKLETKEWEMGRLGGKGGGGKEEVKRTGGLGEGGRRQKRDGMEREKVASLLPPLRSKVNSTVRTAVRLGREGLALPCP